MNIHAQEWLALAAEQEQRAVAGLVHPSIAAARAELYRRTARSSELTETTGEWQCACCVKPITKIR